MSTRSLNGESKEGDAIDIEEELEQFFVRKHNDMQGHFEGNRSRSGGSSELVHEYIPLLLCDVPSVPSPAESSAIHTFGRARFRSFIFHAVVVGRLCDSAAYHKYVVDDGTRTLELSVYRRRSDVEAVRRLQTEVALIQIGNSAAQNKNEISDCLTRLLAKSMEQFNHSNIPVGSKVLVQGRPNWYRGQLGIVAMNVYSDRLFARNLEIAFKDYLIEWYRANGHTKTDSNK